MNITTIDGHTRIIGESQGYLGLPLRDVTINDAVTGPETPAMESAWTVDAADIAALQKGAPIILRVIGNVHPPVMLEVGTVPLSLGETRPGGTSLGELISRAVASKLDAAYVEKEVESRVDKLIAGAVDQALRPYSDTGKLIETAVTEALKVAALDLPSYGSLVAGMLKAQIEARVAPLVAGRLAADMDELLNLAPKEVKLSEIAKLMIAEHSDDYGEVITVIVERADRGYTHVYLDEERYIKTSDKYRCRHHLHLDQDGVIYSATIDNRDLKDVTHVGRSYGIGQRLRAYVACSTKIILDEDDVVISVGDY